MVQIFSPSCHISQRFTSKIFINGHLRVFSRGPKTCSWLFAVITTGNMPWLSKQWKLKVRKMTFSKSCGRYIRTELGHSRVWLSELCWQSATFTQDSIYKVLFTLMMFWWCARSHTTVQPVTCISSSASSLWPWCLVLSLQQYWRLIRCSRRVAATDSLTVQQLRYETNSRVPWENRPRWKDGTLKFSLCYILLVTQTLH